MTGILTLGDSITHGVYNLSGGITVLTPYGGYRGHLYESLLARSYQPVMLGRLTDPIAYGGHEGHDGYMTSQIMAELPAIVTAVAVPDFALVMLGTNDLFGGSSSVATQRDALLRMKDLLVMIRTAWPDVRIIVSKIPPTNSPATSALVTAYNAGLVTATAGQATLVDPGLVYPGTDLADGVHPSTTGYPKVATAFFDAIEALSTPHSAARLTMPSTLDVQVAVSWDGSGAFDGPYDDVTAAVAVDPGITVNEGRDGAQQLNPPQVQAGDVELHNDDGRYSQERGDSPVYQRVLPGKPVKYFASHGERGLYQEHGLYAEHEPYRGAGLYPLGRHVIDDIAQTTGWGARRVKLATLGYETTLTRATVTVPVMVAPRIDACFTALLDAVSWPADKRAISISDTTLLYWWCDERHPWDAMLELLASEGPGTFYVDRDGVFRFENRNYRTITARSTTSQATFLDVSGSGARGLYREDAPYREHGTYRGGTGLWLTSLNYDPGFASVYNRATYTTKRRTLGSLAAIWSLGASFDLSASQSRTFIVRPSDPFQNAVTPVLTTDYTLPSGGTVSVSLSATSGLVAFVTVTATSGSPTVAGLQLRAQPLTVISETTVANSVDASASITKFSPLAGQDIPLPLQVSGWPEIDTAQATGVCDAWVLRQQVPRAPVTITIRNADGPHLEQILRRRVSDRITVVEANTGLEADVWINEATLHILGAGGRVVALELGCEKSDDIGGAVWDIDEWDVGLWGV